VVQEQNCFENTEAGEKQNCSKGAKLSKGVNALRPQCSPKSKTVWRVQQLLRNKSA